MPGNDDKAVMSFGIDSNERLAWLGPFAAVFIAIWILAIVAMLAFSSITIGDSELSKAALAMGLVALTIVVLGPVFIFFHMTYATFSYELHKDAIVIKKGIIAKHRDSIPYEKIANINTESSIFERIFGIGTIKIDTGTGKDALETSIPGVKNREQLVSELLARKSKKNAAKDESGKVENPQIAQINLLKEILEEMKQLRVLLTEKKPKKSFDEMSEMHEHEAFMGGEGSSEEERPFGRKRR